MLSPSLPGAERPATPPRHDPDYSMRHFTLRRFTPEGRLRLDIEGDVMRHYPDTDTVEIDGEPKPALVAETLVMLFLR